MKIITLSLFIASTLIACSETGEKETFLPEIVYQSEGLIITQVSEHAYQHTSYLMTEHFGKVACNGMFVQDNGEVVIFDTPADSASSVELLGWIKEQLNNKVTAVVATHFHADCVGGLSVFHQMKIPSYAHARTIAATKEKGFHTPQNSFGDSLVLEVGHQIAISKFFGEGHTKDNVVGYFPAENILFGGCLIKEQGAGKGNLEDATVASWSATVEKVKQAYPNVQLVIPGHGNYGDQELLDYTINLFKVE